MPVVADESRRRIGVFAHERRRDDHQQDASKREAEVRRHQEPVVLVNGHQAIDVKECDNERSGGEKSRRPDATNFVLCTRLEFRHVNLVWRDFTEIGNLFRRPRAERLIKIIATDSCQRQLESQVVLHVIDSHVTLLKHPHRLRLPVGVRRRRR